MQGVQMYPSSLALLLALFAAVIAGEAITTPSLGFPPVQTQQTQTLQQQQQQQQQQQEQANASSLPVAAPVISAAIMPESKKIESWSPSQPELTQMQQHLASAPPYPPSNNQPFMPSNYYLPGIERKEIYGNDYGPPPSTEYRSEQFAYPYEEIRQPYPYQVSPPQLDTALIPTAKHFVIVSFIGLLLLFAIIQNSIAAAKRKDALVEVLSNRRKRDVVTSTDLDAITPEIEAALKGDERVRCIQRTLCYENRKLFEDLGVFGKVLAKYLTKSVQNSLKDLSPGWDRLVEEAADAGLRGEDCDAVYKDCNYEIAKPEDKKDDEE